MACLRYVISSRMTKLLGCQARNLCSSSRHRNVVCIKHFISGPGFAFPSKILCLANKLKESDFKFPEYLSEGL